jgi:hypothetical protein
MRPIKHSQTVRKRKIMINSEIPMEIHSLEWEEIQIHLVVHINLHLDEDLGDLKIYSNNLVEEEGIDDLHDLSLILGIYSRECETGNQNRKIIMKRTLIVLQKKKKRISISRKLWKYRFLTFLWIQILMFVRYMGNISHSK